MFLHLPRCWTCAVADPTAPVQQAQPGALTKFHDLVVKCLIKLTKGLQASQEVREGLKGVGLAVACRMGGQFGCAALHPGACGPAQQKHACLLGRGTARGSAAARFTRPCRRHPQQGVDLGGLLFNIHDFFLFLGVDEIRKRSSSDDKPLRMVKTILHELCKMLVRTAGGHAVGGRACGWPAVIVHVARNRPARAVPGAGALAGGGVDACCRGVDCCCRGVDGCCRTCDRLCALQVCAVAQPAAVPLPAACGVVCPLLLPPPFYNLPAGLQHLPVHRRHPRARRRPAAHHLCLHQVRGNMHPRRPSSSSGGCGLSPDASCVCAGAVHRLQPSTQQDDRTLLLLLASLAAASTCRR